MEKLERRRQRRAERRQQAGETPEVAQPAVPEKPREAEVGSKVKIAGQDIPGVVLSIKGRKAQVAFGQILTTVDRSSLVVISGAEFKQATRPVQPRTVVSVDVSARKLNFKDHIDVRGLRAAEALEEVRDFIDDAIMVGVGSRDPDVFDRLCRNFFRFPLCNRSAGIQRRIAGTFLYLLFS